MPPQDTGIRVQKPVHELADTGSASFFAILGDVEVEIEKSKNMGGLRISPRYGIKQKKNQKSCVTVPLNSG